LTVAEAHEKGLLKTRISAESRKAIFSAARVEFDRP
jgi:hypothetical protein